jgi:coenzyme F420-reducing hydrogenase delta subunit
MSEESKVVEDFSPKILVFSTENVSDPGIDLAGRNKMHYSPTVYVITLPCSSGIKPKWILHAIERGFDGVFIAADGSDCAYVPDCTAKTAKIVSDAQGLLKTHSHDPARIKMAALCSVCAEPFEKYMKNFGNALRKLGPAGKGGRAEA